MDMKLIGERIRAARLSKGITQTELARMVGKSQNAVSNYEIGSRVMPITDIMLFVEVLDKPLSYFFGDVEPNWELSDLYDNLDPGNKQLAANYLQFLLKQQSQAS
jgi:transcriptional regulator with XRE-family HTH domain